MLEHDGTSVVIDPGQWSDDFTTPNTVIAVIVTHEHFDHCDVKKIQKIIQKNPEAIIYAHTDVTRQLLDLPTKSVAVGEVISVGPFTFEFFGGKHAIIHPDFEHPANLGVLINNTVYYPGDSFAEPGTTVKVLALPVSAPWLKISEVIDFLVSIKPELAFPTHDAIASDFGKEVADNTLARVAQLHDIAYQRIDGSTEV